ncbi:MAG TPA: hypothetical protein VK369_17565 [Segetibacter sp.]|nr:hypothetical protein [Segetibacter sp.]
MDYTPCWILDLDLEPERLQLIAVSNRVSQANIGDFNSNPTLTTFKVRDRDMALKAKIANKVETDVQGYVEGKIVAVLDVEETTKIEKGKEVIYAAQFEFQIEAQASQKPILYRIWTGQTLNNEKYELDDETKDYNKFTRLMLLLGLVDEKELKEKLGSININVDDAEGMCIKFKLEKSRKTKGLSIPVVSSIKPIESPKTAKPSK